MSAPSTPKKKTLGTRRAAVPSAPRKKHRKEVVDIVSESDTDTGSFIAPECKHPSSEDCPECKEPEKAVGGKRPTIRPKLLRARALSELVNSLPDPPSEAEEDPRTEAEIEKDEASRKLLILSRISDELDMLAGQVHSLSDALYDAIFN